MTLTTRFSEIQAATKAQPKRGFNSSRPAVRTPFAAQKTVELSTERDQSTPAHKVRA
ncbi:MAG: hypothetical protein M3Q74_08075 [Pseudomonadota bacterium]|nr:hypothetical protein [Pseudomonadota bacterium]